MFFRIEPNTEVPIYEQLVRQVKFAVADGALTTGQLLPGARTLSVELAINPNTIVRAYQELQREGILEPVRGRGLAVCQGAKKVCLSMRRDLVTQRLAEVLTEAVQGGLDEATIRKLVDRELARLLREQPATFGSQQPEPTTT